MGDTGHLRCFQYAHCALPVCCAFANGKYALNCANPSYLFDLTKEIFIVGPYPALSEEVATNNDFQKRHLWIKPGNYVLSVDPTQP
jgi:hypothetical protein